MKFLLNQILFIGLIIVSQISYSQIKIGSNGSSFVPHPSSIMEVEATDKGLLLPRVSDLSNIQNPAVGLVVFLTTDSKLYNYTITGWRPIGSADTLSLSNRINAKLNTRNGMAYNLNVTDSLRVNGIRIGLGKGNISSNQAIGYQALNMNNFGNNNTANGYQALSRNTDGNNNTAHGYQALHLNTLGNNNTATGFSALYSNVASYNTAFGSRTLLNNTEGENNTANGYSALFTNTGGQENTANGAYALYNNNGTNNTANGAYTLFSNTTGSFNSASGANALYSNTSGQNNTANGYFSLHYNSIGQSNTANGTKALFANTYGSSNTANGTEALNSNTLGNNNTATGYRVLRDNVNGSNNTANGDYALENSTGSYNIALGSNAGINLTSGNNNIAIGYNTNFPSATGSYQLNIGNEIYGQNVDNSAASSPVQIAIGTTAYNGTSTLTVNGHVAAVGYSSISDRRFKKGIQGINLGLKEVLQLKPSSYYWNSQNERMKSADPTKLQYGFIAQELEKIIPGVVSGDGSEKDYKSVNYEALIPVLTKAIQEQQVMIEGQQELIEGLKKSNRELIRRLDKMEGRAKSEE